MKKNLLDFYKPNRLNTGSAIQISKTNKGLNLQVAKQKQSNNVTFDWYDNSHSTTISYNELIILLSKFNSLKNDLFTRKLNCVKEYVSLEDSTSVFKHASSTSPKLITFNFEEYPINSGNIVFKVSICSCDETDEISFIFKKEEYEAFFLVVEDQIKSVFDKSLIESVIVNTSSGKIDRNGIEEYKTIWSIYLPNLSVGEYITNIRTDLKNLKVIKKHFDTELCKPIYFVVQE